jgi:uncharacterized protein (TIGR03083 family)
MPWFLCCGSNLRRVDSNLDYVAHLTRESARFAEVLRGVAPDTPVPSCPGWSADDLAWHLGEVQWFWAAIVREDLTGERAQELKPPRPSGHAALLTFLERASHDLAEVLAATPPQTAAWTWSDDKSVAFIRRRQAHEALMHRIDAELTAGNRTPLDPSLSADGIDEALRVMYGGVPDWGTFSPDEARTLRLQATDTGDSWLVTLGRFTGTDSDGASYDEPDIHAAERDPGTQTAAQVAGAAADLDCWLWHRPPIAPVERSGDDQVLSGFDAAIELGIN